MDNYTNAKNKKWLKRAEALESLEEDKLLSDYYEYVKNLIISIQPPFVLGVSGEWGRGKTTLFNFLKNDLKDEYATVHFESWKYQKSGNLSYAFVNSIVSLLKSEGISEENNIRNILELVKKLPKISIPLGLVHTEINFEKIKNLYDVIRNIEGNFNEIVQKLLKKIKKNELIVFVDDLDRCLPEFSLDFLENIKHFFSVENVIFVIALDEELLETALQIRYSDNSNFTSKVYLEKIIDLFIRLPQYKAENLETYIKFLLEKKYPLKNIIKEEYLNEVVGIAGKIPKVEKSTIMTNPRKLDRIVKNMMIGIKSVPQDSILHKSYPLFFLMLILREYYHSIFSSMQENPNIIILTWSVRTRESKLGNWNFTKGTEMSREQLDSLGQDILDFYQNSESSE